MQIFARLAWTEDSAVFAGSHPGLAFEGGREMALIAIASRGRDLDEGSIGSREFAAGPLDPQTPEVVADCAVEMPAERPRQVGGVYTGGRRDLVEREAFREPVVEKLFGA